MSINIISFDKYIQQLIAQGNIQGATLLSTLPPTQSNGSSPPPRPRNIILAQKGLNIKLIEAQSLLENLAKNALHLDYVTVAGVQYIITSIQEKSFYGRNISDNTDGGIILCKTAKSLLIATYASNEDDKIIPGDVIFTVERHAEKCPQ